MFKDREFKVTMNKKNKEETPETPEDIKAFETKVDIVLHKLERIGVGAFLGVCAYVLLDTFRQTSIEKIKYESPE
jgi:hypothetical protein